MVNITLSNHNPSSQDRAVSININKGLCTFADNREIALKKLMNESDFSHPLLKEPFTPSPDHLFHYEYDDVDGLLYSAIFIYATLLRADNPRSCLFKINPSLVFQQLSFGDELYVSIHRHKIAQESINISQFESLVGHLFNVKFKFSECLIIEDMFTVQDLPPTINGDALYQTKSHIVELLKVPKEFSRYELRYINSMMGFGVFSREEIKNGDIIGMYSGVKTANRPVTLKYAFKNEHDCLNMYIDAQQFGNITRFINHAPSPNKSDSLSKNTSLVAANITPMSHFLNGIETIVYTANKDVPKGEQLLVDYGADFFTELQPIRFNTKGQLIDKNKKFLRKNTRNKIYQLRVMASHGVKQAQTFVLLRMLIILAFITIGLGLLNHT